MKLIISLWIFSLVAAGILFYYGVGDNKSPSLDIESAWMGTLL